MEKNNSIEDWSNFDTWYVNLRITNNPIAYRMLVEGKPFTQASAMALVKKMFLMNIQSRHIFGEDLFEKDANVSFSRRVDYKELADSWNCS